MTLFLTMIVSLLLMVDDGVLYQQLRYQPDRMRATCTIHYFSLIVACGYYLVEQFCKFCFPGEPILFHLILLVGINELCRQVKPHFQQLHLTHRMLRFILILFLGNGLLFLLLSNVHPTVCAMIIPVIFVFHAYLFYCFVLLVHPMEERIRQQFVRKAKEKLLHFHGIVVGITGSYGKTSIKNIVAQVCSPIYATLKTPYSYNNQMGISKTILEELDLNYELFICEMGADHLHEIEDLANFIHPTMGIVSAIGPQHLSTFKSMENILHEKLQLLESLPENGVGFINQDNRYLREYDYHMKCKIVTVGIENPSDIQAVHVQTNHRGSEFDVMIDGKSYAFRIQLLGEHNVINCLFAIAVAHELKIPMDCVQGVLNNMQAIPHRLELKHFGKGMCIDNAYNSNPDSARLSLRVLKQMPHQRYCITPGFIDLGKDQDHYSFEFGKQLAEVCDWVILVGTCSSIVEGMRVKGFDENHRMHFATMKEALEYVSCRLNENDTCLIENDIPEILTHS